MSAGGIELTALEASHPAAFLATLGALDLLATSASDATACWRPASVSWRPSIVVDSAPAPESLIELLACAHEERDIDRELGPEKAHQLDRLGVRRELELRDKTARAMRASLMAELPPSRSGKPPLSPFAIYQPGQGRDFTKLARSNSRLEGKRLRDALRNALFGPWKYRSSGTNPLRWDPATSLQERAYEADASTNMGTRAVPGLMLLAIRGLRFYPLITEARRARPRGWVTTEDLRGPSARRWSRSFVWPIWEDPLGRDAVGLILSNPELTKPKPDYGALRAHGVSARFVAELAGPSSGAQALAWGERV